MKPTFFATPAAFRAWLKKHHKTADELWVGYYRKDCGKPTITWQESVDEALCFGWIDGIRKKVSDEAYTNRFTPRRARQQLERDQYREGRRADQTEAHAGRRSRRIRETHRSEVAHLHLRAEGSP